MAPPPRLVPPAPAPRQSPPASSTPPEPERPAHLAFDELRTVHTSATRPSLPDAGWHLSYFGTASDLATKFQTWGHARTFWPPPRGFERNGHEAHALAPERIARCARYCLEPIAKACQALATPCNWSHYLSRRVPPCLGREDHASRPLVDSEYCPHRMAELRKRRAKRPLSPAEMERAELPAPLLASNGRKEYLEYYEGSSFGGQTTRAVRDLGVRGVLQ